MGAEYWVPVDGAVKRPPQKFTFTSPEKCRPLTQSTNVQAELQTIYSIMFLLFDLFFFQTLWDLT